MKVKIITLEIIFFKKQLAKKAVLKRLQQLFVVNSVQENLQCCFMSFTVGAYYLMNYIIVI